MPYTDIKFVKRTARIVDFEGETLWEREVEVPDTLSEQSVNIIADKYLHSRGDGSLKDMIDTVSERIAESGFEQGYFDTEEDKKGFCDLLKWIQITGVAGFNSPVYFNVGTKKFPQVSACFINGMEDTMESITDLAKREAKIFQNGSGSGVDYSVLRSSKEPVKKGNNASGPVSFLKVHDTLAGEVKSGGVVRRAARMAVLDITHPDIVDFIKIKSHEEEKIRALAQAGIEPFITTRLEDEVYFQNTNLSVRMDKSFLAAAEKKEDWDLLAKDGSVIATINAAVLMDLIAQGAWESAEPGVHFKDNINAWNTVPHKGRIESSNPCSEFMFLNDSACNLAAINLVKLFYKQPKNPWNFVQEYIVEKVIQCMTWAMDILVETGTYPNKKIEKTSHKARPLGLGFSDLGSYLMLKGVAYGSERGRQAAKEVMNTIASHAHLASSEIAEKMGSYSWFDKVNHMKIVQMHKEAAAKYGLDTNAWDRVMERGVLRNAQLTLLAPCGTMGFLLDNATTGIEPIFSHVSYKNLQGGGQMKLVNRYLNEALKNMGYGPAVFENDQLSFQVKPNDANVFATASGIHWKDHLKMMAAVQPFLSGSISKTVNMPKDCEPDDIKKCYYMAHELGLKSVIIYRDGSKNGQVLTTKKVEQEPITEIEKVPVVERQPLPKDRLGGTHKFVINGEMKGYLTWSVYENGKLGEVFVNIAKEGSTLSGLLDSMATMVSVSLQYGVPLFEIVDKMIHRRFEPSGMTNNPEIRFADSIVDYIFKYLGMKFLNPEECALLGLHVSDNKMKEFRTESQIGSSVCPKCGLPLRRLGTCEQCNNCSYSGGSCS